MKLLLLMAVSAAALFGSESALGFVPSSNTTVTNGAVRANKLFLANTTASAVTITVKDRTTNCNGSACQVFPAISIAANTVYTVDLGGIAMTGIDWSASTGNAVVGQISYGNQ